MVKKVTIVLVALIAITVAVCTPAAVYAGEPMAKYKILVLDDPYALIEDWTEFEFTRERFGLGTFELTLPIDHTQADALVQYRRILIVRGDDDWDNQAARLWGIILNVKKFYAEDAGPDLGGTGEGAMFVTAIGVTYTEYFLSGRGYPLPTVVSHEPRANSAYHTDWSGSYADVDEGVDNHDSDSTYQAASNQGDTVAWEMDNYADVGTEILGIRVRIVVRTTGSDPYIPNLILTNSQHDWIFLAPKANGTDTDWTGDVSDVDEDWQSPDDDTTYINSSTVGHQESFEIPGSGLGSHAAFPRIKSWIRARKTTADAVTVKLYTIIGGTRYYSAVKTLTTSYAWYSYEMTTNPATGECWKETDLQGIEIGVEIVSCVGGEARVTTMALELEDYVFQYELDPVESTYVVRYVDLDKDPDTGEAWTDTKLDILEIGLRLVENHAAEVRVTAADFLVYHKAIQTTDNLDDVLKLWVHDNLGSGADAARQVTGFTEEADESAGPSDTYEIAYNILLQKFLDLCKQHDVGMEVVGNWGGGGCRLNGGAIKDEAGGSFGPLYHGLSLADGVAFFRCQGVDLSGYAGVEGTSTPYKLELTDSAGKVASGYIGAADAAEALGGELVTNGGFPADTSGWTAGNSATLTSVAGGQAGNCLQITENGENNPYAYQNINVVAGKLYKLQLYIKQGTESTYYLNVRAVENIFTESGEATGSWVQHTYYFTAPSGCSSVRVRIYQLCNNGAGTTLLYDTVTFKEVTHVGVDGIHIVSAKDGSTRNWTDIESGFDYNDSAYTFEVLPAYTYEFQTSCPEGTNRTHSQSVNDAVVISRGRGLVKLLDYELDTVSARNVAYVLGEKDGLEQTVQEVEGDSLALAKEDSGLLLKEDGFPILLDHIHGTYRRECILDVEGTDDDDVLTSQGQKFLGDEGAELEIVKYEHSNAAIHIPLKDFVPGDIITFYDSKFNIGPLQPKVESITCQVSSGGVETYEVTLGIVKRPAFSEDAAFRGSGKRRTLYVKGG